MTHLFGGLALGEILNDIILNKTFISDNETNSSQEHKKGKLKELTQTLEEEYNKVKD